jgi:hypothetical protein
MSIVWTKEKLKPLQHLTMKEAAKELGCSYPSLHAAAKRVGVKFKPADRHTKGGPRKVVDDKPKVPVQPPYETVGLSEDQLGVIITVLPMAPRDQPSKFKSHRLLSAGESVKLKRGRPRKVA